MNIYVLIEGETAAKEIYSAWIPYTNSKLAEIYDVADFNRNNFYIFSAHGYPFYFEAIANAIDDINAIQTIDRLVIALDSEDMTLQEKLDEVNTFLRKHPCRAEIKIVVQHFCIETWALGNRKIMSGNIQNGRLNSYKKYFNVYKEDPELMPPYPPEELNRATFAYKYLVRLLNEKNRNLSYSKSNARTVIPKTYYDQVTKRLVETNHISSFQLFLQAFV